MKVWMIYITVKERTAGSPRTIARWLDSQWAAKESASGRVLELQSSMRNFECYRVPGTDTGASPEIIEGSVADAGLVIPDTPESK